MSLKIGQNLFFFCWCTLNVFENGSKFELFLLVKVKV